MSLFSAVNGVLAVLLLLAASPASAQHSAAEHPSAAVSEKRMEAPPHIAAAQMFILAWGHQRWDQLRTVAADTVPVNVGDRVFHVEAASSKTDVMLVFPFRGLSTMRNGEVVQAIMVDELGIKVGDQEIRGPATLSLRDNNGRMEVTEVSLRPATR
jgi:hypothetical protein